MKIQINVRTDKIGSECVDEFEIEGDETEEEIEEMAREAMFNMIEWNWKRT